jgi:hypothetical protein
VIEKTQSNFIGVLRRFPLRADQGMSQRQCLARADDLQHPGCQHHPAEIFIVDRVNTNDGQHTIASGAQFVRRILADIADKHLGLRAKRRQGKLGGIAPGDVVVVAGQIHQQLLHLLGVDRLAAYSPPSVKLLSPRQQSERA